MELQVPIKLKPLYFTDKRFIVIYGGRGSAKSWGVADFLIIKAVNDKKRILCTREIQKSIKDSVHKLLTDRINTLNLQSFFKITEKQIVGINGSEFIFKGLRHNPDDIKSTEGIDYCWDEEAQSTSKKSLEILTPTIRKPNSQIIFTYNPTNITDPVHTDYTLAERDDCLKIEMNWQDNPFFPDVLGAERDYDKRVDYDKYLHKWEGQCVKHSEAQIFYGKWEVDSFKTPENVVFYYGADWGFSNDPTCLVRSFIVNKTLYIDYEAWGVGVDIDKTPELFDLVPGSRLYNIKADSARPETISYMVNQGFRIRGARKGKGSVLDGIYKIRGFEKIIIHQRCQKTIEEFRNYSWKVDQRTEEISNVPEDKCNHIIDALRYALEDILSQYAVGTRL